MSEEYRPFMPGGSQNVLTNPYDLALELFAGVDAAARIDRALRLQSIEKVQQQGVGFDALPGLVGKNKKRVTQVELLVDSPDGTRIGAIEKEQAPPSRFCGGVGHRFHSQIGIAHRHENHILKTLA